MERWFVQLILYSFVLGCTMHTHGTHLDSPPGLRLLIKVLICKPTFKSCDENGASLEVAAEDNLLRAPLHVSTESDTHKYLKYVYLKC